MKNEMFTELLGSAREALEHAQGKRSLRTTTLPLPPKPLNGRAVKRLRATLHASQAVFARYLNVSTKLVQAWEANRRHPEGPALVLLHIAAEQPGMLERVRHNSGVMRARRLTTPRRRTARTDRRATGTPAAR
jgi:putative transcriptional regulator